MKLDNTGIYFQEHIKEGPWCVVYLEKSHKTNPTRVKMYLGKRDNLEMTPHRAFPFHPAAKNSTKI